MARDRKRWTEYFGAEQIYGLSLRSKTGHRTGRNPGPFLSADLILPDAKAQPYQLE